MSDPIDVRIQKPASTLSDIVSKKRAGLIAYAKDTSSWLGYDDGTNQHMMYTLTSGRTPQYNLTNVDIDNAGYFGLSSASNRIIINSATPTISVYNALGTNNLINMNAGEATLNGIAFIVNDSTVSNILYDTDNLLLTLGTSKPLAIASTGYVGVNIIDAVATPPLNPLHINNNNAFSAIKTESSILITADASTNAQGRIGLISGYGIAIQSTHSDTTIGDLPVFLNPYGGPVYTEGLNIYNNGGSYNRNQLFTDAFGMVFRDQQPDATNTIYLYNDGIKLYDYFNNNSVELATTGLLMYQSGTEAYQGVELFANGHNGLLLHDNYNANIIEMNGAGIAIANDATATITSNCLVINSNISTGQVILPFTNMPQTDPEVLGQVWRKQDGDSDWMLMISPG